jgi:hypothetical protein
MSSEFLGVRLNHKKHKDIIDWLKKFNDRSEEARRLMSIAIRISKAETMPQAPEPPKQIVWNNFPKEKPKSVSKKKDVTMNIIGSFEE